MSNTVADLYRAADGALSLAISAYSELAKMEDVVKMASAKVNTPVFDEAEIREAYLSLRQNGVCEDQELVKFARTIEQDPGVALRLITRLCQSTPPAPYTSGRVVPKQSNSHSYGNSTSSGSAWDKGLERLQREGPG